MERLYLSTLITCLLTAGAWGASSSSRMQDFVFVTVGTVGGEATVLPVTAESPISTLARLLNPPAGELDRWFHGGQEVCPSTKLRTLGPTHVALRDPHVELQLVRFERSPVPKVNLGNCFPEIGKGEVTTFQLSDDDITKLRRVLGSTRFNELPPIPRNYNTGRDPTIPITGTNEHREHMARPNVFEIVRRSDDLAYNKNHGTNGFQLTFPDGMMHPDLLGTVQDILRTHLPDKSATEIGQVVLEMGKLEKVDQYPPEEHMSTVIMRSRECHATQQVLPTGVNLAKIKVRFAGVNEESTLTFIFYVKNPQLLRIVGGGPVGIVGFNAGPDQNGRENAQQPVDNANRQLLAIMQEIGTGLTQTQAAVRGALTDVEHLNKGFSPRLRQWIDWLVSHLVNDEEVDQEQPVQAGTQVVTTLGDVPQSREPLAVAQSNHDDPFKTLSALNEDVRTLVHLVKDLREKVQKLPSDCEDEVEEYMYQVLRDCGIRPGEQLLDQLPPLLQSTAVQIELLRSTQSAQVVQPAQVLRAAPALGSAQAVPIQTAQALRTEQPQTGLVPPGLVPLVVQGAQPQQPIVPHYRNVPPVRGCTIC